MKKIENKIYWNLNIISNYYKNLNVKVLVKCDCWFYKKIIYKDILYWKSKTCWKCSNNIKILPWMRYRFLTILKRNITDIEAICDCWKTVYIKSSRLSRYKSCWCMKKWNENSNWKWWIRDIKNNIRKSKKYIEWRNSCFIRDWYKCVISWDNKNLIVHHIIPMNKIYENEELLYDINNWITITDELHREFHSLYWVKNIWINEINDFIKKKSK